MSKCVVWSTSKRPSDTHKYMWHRRASMMASETQALTKFQREHWPAFTTQHLSAKADTFNERLNLRARPASCPCLALTWFKRQKNCLMVRKSELRLHHHHHLWNADGQRVDAKRLFVDFSIMHEYSRRSERISYSMNS